MRLLMGGLVFCISDWRLGGATSAYSVHVNFIIWPRGGGAQDLFSGFPSG